MCDKNFKGFKAKVEINFRSENKTKYGLFKIIQFSYLCSILRVRAFK